MRNIYSMSFTVLLLIRFAIPFIYIYIYNFPFVYFSRDEQWEEGYEFLGQRNNQWNYRFWRHNRNSLLDIHCVRCHDVYCFHCQMTTLHHVTNRIMYLYSKGNRFDGCVKVSLAIHRHFLKRDCVAHFVTRIGRFCKLWFQIIRMNHEKWIYSVRKPRNQHNGHMPRIKWPIFHGDYERVFGIYAILGGYQDATWKSVHHKWQKDQCIFSYSDILGSS